MIYKLLNMYKNRKKEKSRRRINIGKSITISALCALMAFSLISTDSADAALKTVGPAEKITTFQSSTSKTDRLKATLIDDYTLRINCVSSLESYLYKISLYKIGENKGDIGLKFTTDPIVSYTSEGALSYGFNYDFSTLECDVPDGYYNLYIHRATSYQDAENRVFRGVGLMYKNLEIRVKNDKIYILKFNDVINYNNQIRKDAANYDMSSYLDTTLSDVKFTLKNPSTGYYDIMSEGKILYMKSISDRICFGLTDDYSKLKAIYTYVASNFYYDTIAFQTHSLQYANPYDNVYHFENGLSSANSYYGKVYTTCQGFSAIYTELARLQGIPTRFVYGHRLSIPSNDWYTESDIDKLDHWWVESYINGRWIYADPTVGTTNKYNKNTHIWTENGLTNYVYFDPSPEQIAMSTVYMCVYPNYRKGQYISNPSEMDKLKTFFGTIVRDEDNIYSYTTNGRLLRSTYTPEDPATWSTGTLSHFMTDGRGNTSQIKWNKKGLSGEMNLSGFKKITYLSAYGNELESVNLSGNTSLKSIYLYDNNISSVDLTGCTKASYIRCKNNPMKYAALYVCGANRTFECGDNGYFYFTTDNKYTKCVMSLYSKPDLGYRLKGIYSKVTGKLISKKTLYDFNPKASSYYIEFELDPDSYKYEFKAEDRSTLSKSKRTYLQLLARRLNETGYYRPGLEVGNETYYTAELQEALTKFQIMNGFTNRGTCDNETWSALFTTGAVEMVSSEEFDIITQTYNEKLQSDIDLMSTYQLAAQVANTVNSKGNSGMTVTWTTADSAYSDVRVDGYEVNKAMDRDFTKDAMISSVVGGNNCVKEYISTVSSGTRYYYRVRAYKVVDGIKFYSQWSNITYRKCK